MATERINLLGGTYLTRSPIGSVERCVNLYPEKNLQGQAASPFTELLTPGLTFKRSPLTPGAARGLYTATTGALYYVCGTAVYFVDVNFNMTQLGTLLAPLSTMVEMQDNGNVLVLVDNTSQGYAVNLQTGILGQPLAFTVTNNGTGGTAGNYSVPLTGGSGTGATLTATVAGGAVIVVGISGGANYVVGDVCSATIPGLSGFSLKLSAVGAAANAFGQITDPNFLGGTGIGYVDTFLVISQPNSRVFYSSLSNVTFAELTSGTAGQPQLGATIAAGTGGTPGTYSNQALTGGSGSGATATIVVGGGGTVTSVTLNPTGQGYNAGDVLSASIAGPLVGFQFSLAQVNPSAFNPLFFASKTGYPDLLSTLVTVHREIWLMGAFESTEVWYDAGGAAFPFQIMPGIFLQHGCIAPASVATHDLDVFWLGVDNAGQGTVFMGTGYRAQRISTWGIANLISGYLNSAGTISDAIGLVYKQQDHIFYVLTFPAANATLVYDRTENIWHERTWTDPHSGAQNRVRFNCAAQAYGLNVVADWQTGDLYILDLMNATDNGAPIVRYRSFQHLINNGKRVSYDQLALDIQAGAGIPSAPGTNPQVTLLVSDDRGATFRACPLQSFGAQGLYLVQPQWRQLGLARDRVFAVQWSDGAFTALQGAWLDFTPAET